MQRRHATISIMFLDNLLMHIRQMSRGRRFTAAGYRLQLVTELGDQRASPRLEIR
jgi:hypothetical protein